MKYNILNSLGDKVVGGLTTLLLASFYIFASDSWGVYIMLGITVFIFVITAYQRRLQIPMKLDSFHLDILGFISFIVLSAIWAQDASLAIDKAITIFEILVCMSVLYCYYSRDESIERLLIIIMWTGYIVTIYTFWRYGISYIRTFVEDSIRFENAFANVNAIAMLAAISIIITMYRLLYKKVSISYLLIFPSIYLIAATGSRKAFLMTIVGIVALLLIRFSSKNIIITIVRFTIIGVVIYLGAPHVLSLDLFSGINHRMEGLIASFTGNGEVDNSSWLRQQYTLIGWEQFKRTPLLGIGIGNSSILLKSTIGSGTYLHNNYAELLACGGLIGVIIYYRTYITLLVNFIKYWNSTNAELIICTVLMVIILVMDYGNVSYYSKNTYVYLMLFYLQLKKLRNSRVKY